MRWVIAILIILPIIPFSVKAECFGWRETMNCDGHGLRNPSEDLSCQTTVLNGRSGYCECENRRRVREVDCNHHPFDCETACKEHASADLNIPYGYEFVTCGSTIKVVHESSRFRLHSHEVNYGSGSGQQSVTAHQSIDDPNSYWLVKEADGSPPCKLGEKIKCGNMIRLEHVNTRKNLHTHKFPSPLSSRNEVSGFGVAGEGDIGDSWIVECIEKLPCEANSSCTEEHAWKREELVRFRNFQTKDYLTANFHHKFDDSNCPGCPINGQLEISATEEVSDNHSWFAAEGIYISYL